MTNKYKDYYERIQNGERDLDIALEAGLSVDTLYRRFTEYQIIKPKKRNSEEIWIEQYELYKLGKSVAFIARDLDVRLSTVYNHFYGLGLEMTPKKTFDKVQFFKDYEDGLSHTELSKKYNLTVTYIRTLLRNM